MAVLDGESNNDEMPWSGARNRRKRNGTIQSYESSSMLNGESEEIDIAHLPRPVNVTGVYTTTFK
jgi:hypothetical protein